MNYLFHIKSISTIDEDNFSKFEDIGNEENSLNETIDSNRSLKCTLCIDYFIQPISLPCNHTFCFFCFERCLSYNPHCPICRKEIEENKINEIIKSKKINKDIENLTIKLIGLENYEKKINEILVEKKELNKNQIQIEYGNLTEPLNSQKSFTPKTKCKWTLYVKVIKTPSNLPIEKVEFFINPHLPKCPPIVVKNPPFILERNGSYEFGMSIKIHFKSKLKIDPYSAFYEVNLRQPKSYKNFFVNIKSS